MKQTKIALAVILLAVACLFSACTSLPALEQDRNGYTDGSTGVRYVFASQNYLALSIGEDAITRIARKTAGDILLYEIEGLSTARFLTTERGELVYADSLTLPKLWEMQVTSFGIFPVQAAHLSIATVKEEDVINGVIDSYRTGEFFEKSQILAGMSAVSYELKFTAGGDYAGIGYSLYYLHYDKDVCIYDTVEDRETYQSIYPSMAPTFEEFTYTDDEGNEQVELLAVYNFGTELLYDRATGLCCAAGDWLVSYLQ